MQLKDIHKLFVLNKDDDPSILQQGEITDALNVRMGSSDKQHGVGVAETLQGEIEILINPDASVQTYYGSAIGGEFVYDGFEEIVIGTQIWMKRNYNINYPGSKAQADDEANADIYGRLYTWFDAMAGDFVPDGWRVPTEADIDTLLTFLGGEMIAGGVLKEVGTGKWLPPNTGATDAYGFRALPGGKFDDVFALLGAKGLFWIADEHIIPDAAALLDKDGNEYTSLIIGTQEWILENLKVETYADGVPIPYLNTDVEWTGESGDEVNYGYLYNWYAATDIRNIANSDWHLPDNSEWETLKAFLGGLLVAGGKLKEIGLDHWNTPNTGATNSSGFNARASGFRSTGGDYTVLKIVSIFHSDETYGGAFQNVGPSLSSTNEQMTHLQVHPGDKVLGLPVRILKDSTILSDGEIGTYTGNNGRVYPTICIGTQEWIACALAETKYRNGDNIPEVTDDATWITLITGGRCSYDNDEANAITILYTPSDGYCAYDNDKPTYKDTYGLLYNKLAVESAHILAYLERNAIQEIGWRVPSESDFDTLIAYLGGLANAGGKLKEVGEIHWAAPNTGATDEVGFKALPAGVRENTGLFAYINNLNVFWTTDDNGLLGIVLMLQYDHTDAVESSYEKTRGYSVRLMRDTSSIPPVVIGQYVIFTDGVSTWRKGVRTGAFNLDHALTPTGFAGAEGIDWENVKIFI